MRRVLDRAIAVRKSSGVTLIDVLIVLGSLSIIMAAVSAVYIAGMKVYFKANRLSDRQEQVRTALNYMIRDVRELGYDPSGAMTALGLTTALLTAGQSSLEFLGGVSRDGATTYKVKYAYTSAGTACSYGCITRQVAGWNATAHNFDSYAAATLVATTVAGLSFTYYDNAGSPCPAGGCAISGLPLTPANREKVRRVVIQITGAVDSSNPQVALSSSVRPRNL